MLKQLINAFFGKSVRQTSKCRECGELSLIPNLDHSGICRKCLGFAALLRETENLKKTCTECGRDFPSIEPAKLCFYCRREAMRTEPAPMLDRIRAQNETGFQKGLNETSTV